MQKYIFSTIEILILISSQAPITLPENKFFLINTHLIKYHCIFVFFSYIFIKNLYSR
uniref:Uncharacterized protein n=1 Tax=Lepeophtheirus salmonis TaxID=72036 RepID=A0A0K2UYZ7_LEPSM